MLRGGANGAAGAAALGITSLVLPSAAAHGNVLGGGGTALDLAVFLTDDDLVAHDAVGSGDLFAVSQAGYEAVVAGLGAEGTGFTVTTVGHDDDRMGESGANWTATSASALGSAAPTPALWAAGRILLGGRFGLRTDLQHTVRILRTSGTTATTAAYTAVGAGATIAQGPATGHVLRRDPLATATDAALACVGPTARATTSDGTSYYATSSSDVDGVATWTAWIAWAQAAPRQQYLLAVPA